MAFVRVASTTDLPPGSMREIILGDSCYALANTGGEICALSGVCLHRGGPLAQGALHESTVVCPWHAWEWDCRSGASRHNPNQKVATYPVKIEGADIFIDIP